MSASTYKALLHQPGGGGIVSCHARAPAGRKRRLSHLRCRLPNAANVHHRPSVESKLGHGVIAYVGRSPGPTGDDADSDFTLGFDAFEDYEEFDDLGNRKSLAAQGFTPQNTDAAAKARAAAREELLSTRGGLMTSDLMRTAVEKQQAAARAEALRLQRENSPSLIAEMLANEGFNLEADWQALEQKPRTTTGAAKEGRGTAVNRPEEQVLKRPPTTPKIDAMRRETAEMRRRRRLFDPDYTSGSYDSSSSGSDDDMSASPSSRSAPPGSSGVQEVDVMRQRAQQAANLLQNAGDVVDAVGLGGLKGYMAARDGVSRPTDTSQYGGAFGLNMFTSDTEDDFGVQGARGRANRLKKQTQDPDDILTDKLMGHIGEVYRSALDVPALQQKPAGLKPKRHISHTTTSTPAPAPCPPPATRKPARTPSWPDIDDLADKDEDSLISLLEQLNSPPPALNLSRPSATTPPPLATRRPPASAARHAPTVPTTASPARSKLKESDEVDWLVDDMLGGLLGNGTPAPQLAARPSVASRTSVRPSSTIAASTPKPAPQATTAAPVLQPTILNDDEEAAFERLWASAAAKAAADAARPVPLMARPSPTRPVAATVTPAATTKVAQPIRSPLAPASPIPVASPATWQPEDDDETEFERLYAAATAKVAQAPAPAPVKPSSPALPATSRLQKGSEDDEFEQLYAAAKEAAAKASQPALVKAAAAPNRPSPPPAARSKPAAASTTASKTSTSVRATAVLAPASNQASSIPSPTMAPAVALAARALSPKPQRPAQPLEELRQHHPPPRRPRSQSPQQQHSSSQTQPRHKKDEPQQRHRKDQPQPTAMAAAVRSGSQSNARSGSPAANRSHSPVSTRAKTVAQANLENQQARSSQGDRTPTPHARRAPAPMPPLTPPTNPALQLSKPAAQIKAPSLATTPKQAAPPPPPRTNKPAKSPSATRTLTPITPPPCAPSPKLQLD